MLGINASRKLFEPIPPHNSEKLDKFDGISTVQAPRKGRKSSPVSLKKTASDNSNFSHSPEFKFMNL